MRIYLYSFKNTYSAGSAVEIGLLTSAPPQSLKHSSYRNAAESLSETLTIEKTSEFMSADARVTGLVL